MPGNISQAHVRHFLHIHCMYHAAGLNKCKTKAEVTKWAKSMRVTGYKDCLWKMDSMSVKVSVKDTAGTFR